MRCWELQAADSGMSEVEVCTVKGRLDNVVRILTVGSGKGCLQDVALQIFALCMSHAIHIEPEWIPREQNEIADYISRIVDCDDWLLTRQCLPG